MEVYHGDVSIKSGVFIVEQGELQVEELLEEAKGLVEEFADLFPVELPDELSPFHDIQHQIDLVPRLSLPN